MIMKPLKKLLAEKKAQYLIRKYDLSYVWFDDRHKAEDVFKKKECEHDYEVVPLNITEEESKEYREVNGECDGVNIEKGFIVFKASNGGYSSMSYGSWPLNDCVCLKCKKFDRRASDYVRNYFQRRKQAMEIVNETK